MSEAYYRSWESIRSFETWIPVIIAIALCCLLIGIGCYILSRKIKKRNKRKEKGVKE